MSGSEPKLAQFGPAIVWLLERDVSAPRLAALFGTTAENIRVIAYRARHNESGGSAEEAQLGDPIRPEQAISLGVRFGPDDVVRTPVGARKIQWLRSEIESVVADHAQRYEFLRGIRALRLIAPRVGYPSDCRRIALLAELHQHIAWFFVHAGQCESAAHESQVARQLWRMAYHESPSLEFAECFVKSALIGSHAWLLARRPHDALGALDIARSAAGSIGEPLGSDHFRQRGVALFQLREDDRAAEAFQKSAEAMKRLGEAKVPEQIQMTGIRHIHFLKGLNWEGASELAATARASFGERSLEASMALHWAAACGVSTDSPTAVKQAMALIDAYPSPAPQFGHQLTIRKLLALTPELGFDARLRKAWARRALYENASRSR